MASSRLDPAGLWCIHGKRYDLRKNDFLDNHPGGREHLERCRGRDVTELFESYHAVVGTPRAGLLAPLLADDQTGVPKSMFAWERSALYSSLKQSVRRYFLSRGGGRSLRGDEHKMPRLSACLNAIFTAMFGVAACGWFSGSWVAGAAAAAMYWLGPSGLMHSGSHSAISRRNSINHLGTLLGSFHSAPLHWYIQHVIGHHSHTNMHGYDPDLEHFRHNLPGHRLHQLQPRYEKHSYWRASVALQSMLTTAGPAMLNQGRYLLRGSMEGVPVLNFSELPWHVLNRVALLAGTVVYPFCAFDRDTAAGLVIVPYIVHGLLYYAFSQVSHLQPGLTRRRHSSCWATHQALSCCDYNTSSRLCNILSIGLNSQIVHHLFPTVDPWHYPALSIIVHRVLMQHGIRPLVLDTYAQAACGHLEYVRSINEPTRSITASSAKHLLGLCK